MFNRVIKLDALDSVSANILPLINDNYNLVTLSGDLGAGKTTLVKSLLKNFDIVEDEVTSPTFNILNIYTNSEFQIWHYDLYRLNSAEELFNLNFEEALEQKLVLIEWPEIIAEYLPKIRLHIKIEILNPDDRKYIIELKGQ